MKSNDPLEFRNLAPKLRSLARDVARKFRVLDPEQEGDDAAAVSLWWLGQDFAYLYSQLESQAVPDYLMWMIRFKLEALLQIRPREPREPDMNAFE